MGKGQVRSIGFRPPYSAHSRFAAAFLVLVGGGVLLAAGLPGFATPGHANRLHAAKYERQLLQCWRFEAPIWAVLLGWLLTTDPKARGQPSVNDRARCRHGCASARQPRTRHCRLCNKCVDGFDHHCLWLNTCVGSYNYRAWLGFVAALFVWTILGSSIAWTALWRALALRSRALGVGYRPALLLTGLGAAMAAGWLLALLALHAYFAWKDLTTLEWIISREGDSGTGSSRRARRRESTSEISSDCDAEAPIRRRSTSEILAGASSDCDPEAPVRRRSTSEILAGANGGCDPRAPVRRRSMSEIFAGASSDCDLDSPLNVPVKIWASELHGG